MSKFMLLKTWMNMKFDQLLHDEAGEVNIVAIVILIGIAVVLAIVFKDAIMELIKNLLEAIKGNATDAITPDGAGTTEP